ncbi:MULTISPECIES: GNAT family N-acetyltransferase [unclassified Roseovarius]|uniref:GNAT family N-acetyltransferase n=1 Tax=unclassified Roseovarius TaxID=2614913 RepID=UPI00273EAF06|nr:MULTISPECIES: GNAT family N-acetyltransferase [unclassified Roseovarius]
MESGGEILRTERLLLRPVTVADAGDMQVMVGDFDVVRHTGTWPWPADPAFTEKRCAVGFGDKGGWLVALAGSDLIGTVGVGPDGDFGYMLPQAQWGRGYATEMGRAVVDHAFTTGRWPGLKACVFEDNPASAHVLTKLGFAEGAACTGFCASRNGDFPIRTFTLDAPQA